MMGAYWLCDGRHCAAEVQSTPGGWRPVGCRVLRSIATAGCGCRVQLHCWSLALISSKHLAPDPVCNSLGSGKHSRIPSRSKSGVQLLQKALVWCQISRRSRVDGDAPSNALLYGLAGFQELADRAPGVGCKGSKAGDIFPQAPPRYGTPGRAQSLRGAASRRGWDSWI